MSAIVVTCQRCGQDATSVICTACSIADFVRGYQPEVVRLLRKRERYGSQGIALNSLDQQLAALIRRVQRKALDKFLAPKPVADAIDAMATEAHAMARGFQKIVSLGEAAGDVRK